MAWRWQELGAGKGDVRLKNAQDQLTTLEGLEFIFLPVCLLQNI